MLSLSEPDSVGSGRSRRALFCDVSTDAHQAFDEIKVLVAYPSGALLFVEGQPPCGIFVLRSGKVKLSMCGKDGKMLILKVAEGEVLGLEATLSGTPYQLSAQATGPCKVSFVKRHDLFCFLRAHRDACFEVVEQLSESYQTACHEVRSLRLNNSSQRLAQLLLEWNDGRGKAGKGQSLELMLTQEEIGQKIGVARETVVRKFVDLKRRHIIEGKGSTLRIRDTSGLEKIAGADSTRAELMRGVSPPK